MKPTTNLQKLSQKENWSIFILKGILGQIKCLSWIGMSIDQRALNSHIKDIIFQIKANQAKRMPKNRNPR